MDNAAAVPREFGKGLVACTVCKLVKTSDQFYEGGCENCPFLDMAGDRERVLDCTTSNFQGLISVMDPKSSWAAKWLHLGRFVPGAYAVAIPESVIAQMPPHISDILQDNHITWAGTTR